MVKSCAAKVRGAVSCTKVPGCKLTAHKPKAQCRTKKSRKCTMKRVAKGECTKRKSAPKNASALKKWREAAKAEGYLVKGSSFKPLPRKGSAGYKKIAARAAL